ATGRPSWSTTTVSRASEGDPDGGGGSARRWAGLLGAPPRARAAGARAGAPGHSVRRAVARVPAVVRQPAAPASAAQGQSGDPVQRSQHGRSASPALAPPVPRSHAERLRVAEDRLCERRRHPLLLTLTPPRARSAPAAARSARRPRRAGTARAP